MYIAGHCSLIFLLQCVTMTYYFASVTWCLVKSIRAEFTWCDSGDPLMQSDPSSPFYFVLSLLVAR